MDLKAFLKTLAALSRNLRLLSRIPEAPDEDKLKHLKSAVAVLRSIPLEALTQELEQQERQLDAQREQALQSRREALHGAARERGVSSERYVDHDRVGIFTVRYAQERVRAALGSETAAEFVEAEGRKVFERLQALKENLDQNPFNREVFFGQLKTAYQLLLRDHPHPEGWVAIRLLHAVLVLVRHATDQDFLKKPQPKSFRDYSSARFVYDLARFGEAGWSCGEERLETRTPNMQTVMKGHTIALPALGGQHEILIADLRVKRREG